VHNDSSKSSLTVNLSGFFLLMTLETTVATQDCIADDANRVMNFYFIKKMGFEGIILEIVNFIKHDTEKGR
jgi:hypothetical protein